MKDQAFRKAAIGAAALAFLLFLFHSMAANGPETKVGWFVAPGASAEAIDESKIVISGTGTFFIGEREEVTGGGDWTTIDKDGATTGSGTFEVTGLVRFDQGQPFPPTGLAFLRIKYSDGSSGILVVGCRTFIGGLRTPSSVTEGITASKGFTLYWNVTESGTFFSLP